MKQARGRTSAARVDWTTMSHGCKLPWASCPAAVMLTCFHAHLAGLVLERPMGLVHQLQNQVVQRRVLRAPQPQP